MLFYVICQMKAEVLMHSSQVQELCFLRHTPNVKGVTIKSQELARLPSLALGNEQVVVGATHYRETHSHIPNQ